MTKDLTPRLEGPPYYVQSYNGFPQKNKIVSFWAWIVVTFAHPTNRNLNLQTLLRKYVENV
jgi:hypothetical protein